MNVGHSGHKHRAPAAISIWYLMKRACSHILHQHNLNDKCLQIGRRIRRRKRLVVHVCTTNFSNGDTDKPAIPHLAWERASETASEMASVLWKHVTTQLHARQTARRAWRGDTCTNTDMKYSRTSRALLSNPRGTYKVGTGLLLFFFFFVLRRTRGKTFRLQHFLILNG